jgi:hypothetical protein
MFPHFLRSGLASTSLQSSVLVPVVVGATYFSAGIVVVDVVVAVAVVGDDLICQTAFLPDLTQT